MRHWRFLLVGLILLPLVVGAETIEWVFSPTWQDNSSISAEDQAKMGTYLRGWKEGNPGAVTYFGETRNGITSWSDNILVRMNYWAAGAPVAGWIALKPGDNVLVTLSTVFPGVDDAGNPKEYESPQTAPFRWTLPGGAVPPPGQLPSAFLSANPILVYKGACTVLTWNVQNATTAAIDQGVGTVKANAAAPTSGTRLVCPTVSTAYTLTAIGPGGTKTAVSNVAVTAVPPGCNPPAGVTIKP
jgi:hypothetical protein